MKAEVFIRSPHLGLHHVVVDFESMDSPAFLFEGRLLTLAILEALGASLGAVFQRGKPSRFVVEVRP